MNGKSGVSLGVHHRPSRQNLEGLMPTASQYLYRLPAVVPAAMVLVHNHVRPTRRLGDRGFRAWLSPPDPARLQVCHCAWAPELGPHFRVKDALNAWKPWKQPRKGRRISLPGIRRRSGSSASRAARNTRARLSAKPCSSCRGQRMRAWKSGGFPTGVGLR
jgi:hypothetical protein